MSRLRLQTGLVLPDALFDLSKVIGNFGKLRPPRLDRDRVTLVTLTGGRLSGRTKSPDTFKLLDLAGGQPQVFKPFHEIVWSGDVGESIRVLGAGRTITVEPGQDLVIGHFDKPSDAKQYCIPKGRCRTKGKVPTADLDFAWLYPLMNVDIERGTIPTLVKSKSPFTSTCFGGHFP